MSSHMSVMFFLQLISCGVFITPHVEIGDVMCYVNRYCIYKMVVSEIRLTFAARI